jgi:hypothetical protein
VCTIHRAEFTDNTLGRADPLPVIIQALRGTELSLESVPTPTPPFRSHYHLTTPKEVEIRQNTTIHTLPRLVHHLEAGSDRLSAAAARISSLWGIHSHAGSLLSHSFVPRQRPEVINKSRRAAGPAGTTLFTVCAPHTQNPLRSIILFGSSYPLLARRRMTLLRDLLAPL